MIIKELSEVAMMSDNHLLRNYYQVLGTTPFQHIKNLRLSRARKPFTETDLSISDIVTYLGYSSISNFSYFFKNAFGIAQTVLRKGDLYGYFMHKRLRINFLYFQTQTWNE